MTTVVFAFAAEPELDPRAASVPRAVLARQLPRLLVARLNGAADRGVRFFPFMGQVGGRRRFLELCEPLAPDALRTLHRIEPQPELLIDGALGGDSLVLRALCGASGRPRLEVRIPFSPADPWPAARRILFEVQGLMGFWGAPPALPTWSGELLAHALIAKDGLLALEADFVVPDPGAVLESARRAFELSPGDSELGELLLDVCRRAVLRGADPAPVRVVLIEACASLRGDASFLGHAARIIEVGCGLVESTEIYAQLARARPEHPEAALKAGSGFYRQGRLREARELLRMALDAGNRDPSLRAQLAAAEEVAGDLRARDALLEGLFAEQPDAALPPAVARLLAGYLIDDGRPQRAVEVIDGALERAPAHAGLWLERGRALLALARTADATASLERCLLSDPSREARAEAQRLWRFSIDSQTLPGVQAIEAAIAAGDLTLALARAKALLRRRRDLPEAWLLYGIVRQRRGEPRRAVRALRRSLRLQPALGEAHNRLGVLLMARGRLREGYNHLRRAVELMPTDGSALVHLAQVCEELGWAAEADAALARADQLGGCARESDRSQAGPARPDPI